MKEKEFKEALAAYDWQALAGCSVAVGCTEDTIIPPWVYMLIASALTGIATEIAYITVSELDQRRWQQALMSADFQHLAGEKVVVRVRPRLDPALYMLITQRLKPLVKTLLFGEAGMPKVIAKQA